MSSHIDVFSPKQEKFIIESIAQINIAHGSVRSGKTVCSLFRFMQAVHFCPDSKLWMIGHTSDTIYQNAVRLLLESAGPHDPLAIFRPFLTWESGKRRLRYKDKVISTLGAKDEGALGTFQGKTFSKAYTDEITLYPESIIDMIDTRLSNPHSQLFGSCNPSFPTHKVKQWIDRAEAGDRKYYSLHFTLDDNPYVDQAYKDRVSNSLSGLFYKRNYLGVWCLAQGAIFDFFDRKLHVISKQPVAPDYWIAGVDYGTNNNFACVVIGISTGRFTQTGIKRWVEAEYVWDSNKEGRQKVNSEYAEDLEEFLGPYGVRAVYVDPSAASFKEEMRRRKFHVVDANNDVQDGIEFMCNEMRNGRLQIFDKCKVLIREVESYVWDDKKAALGEDAPKKKDDHAIDALRYALVSHKISTYRPDDGHNPQNYQNNRFGPRF